jgi:hypothetical protein
MRVNFEPSVARRINSAHPALPRHDSPKHQSREVAIIGTDCHSSARRSDRHRSVALAHDALCR